MNRRRLSFLLAFLLLLCSVSFHRLPVNAVADNLETRAAITHSLFYSDYSSADYYINTCTAVGTSTSVPDYADNGLQLRANCYGYAYRLHCFTEGLADSNPYIPYNFYKQQPGEFANKASGFIDIYDEDGDTFVTTVENYYDLMDLYRTTIGSDYESNDSKMSTLIQLMRADANTLGFDFTYCPESAVATSQPSSTRRLIAVVVGGYDYHFYIQHDDGTWSHKPGSSEPRNYCLCQDTVTLTNSNIVDHACEGIYTGGVVRFYYITKNAVIDFGHANGHYDSCVKTTLYSTDGAGNEFQTSKNLGSVASISKYGLIDFCGDVDYYYFTPTTTKTYTFTSTTSSSLPLTITLYNASGTLLTSGSANSGAVNFTYQMQSGTKYFIKVNTSNQTEHEYLREYNFYVS